MKPQKALMISKSVGCIGAYQKIIYSLRNRIRVRPHPQISSTKDSLPVRGSKKNLQICVRKGVGPQSAHL